MKRLLRVLLPAIVFVPVITVSAPVSATLPDTRACAGDYELTLSTAMPNPVDPPAEDVYFTMTKTSGTCTGGPWPPAPESFYGWLDGNCGAATGWGYLPDGHWFNIAWDGTSLVMRGAQISTWGPLVEPSATAAFTIKSSLDCSGTTFDAVGGIWSTPYTDACTGLGWLFLSTPFASLTTRSATFYLDLWAGGACVPSLTAFSATGTVTGNCEFATGQGVSDDGATFDLLWVGNHLYLSGNVIGHVFVRPDEFTPNCVTGADRFLGSGRVVESY